LSSEDGIQTVSHRWSRDRAALNLFRDDAGSLRPRSGVATGLSQPARCPETNRGSAPAK
jgi:hypothetical protein